MRQNHGFSLRHAHCVHDVCSATLTKQFSNLPVVFSNSDWISNFCYWWHKQWQARATGFNRVATRAELSVEFRRGTCRILPFCETWPLPVTHNSCQAHQSTATHTKPSSA